MTESDQRRSGIRRDFNDLVRDESGKISGSKLGTYAGQFISGKLLLTHSEDLIEHWDSLAIMFTVLIAPEIWRKFMAMKYGSGSGYSEHTETSSTVVSKTAQKVDNPDGLR